MHHNNSSQGKAMQLLLPLLALLLISGSRLSNAFPTPDLFARYSSPAEIPSVCAKKDYFCLTVQSLNSALVGFHTKHCGVHQTIDHDGYSWRTFVFNGRCSGEVLMSCQVTPTGLVEQIPFSFGFGTIGPKKDRHASFIHAGAPGIVGKDSYGNHMDGNGMVGSKRLNNGRWWVNFQVWCSMW